MSKASRLKALVEEMQELYPDLDGIMIDDVEDPSCVIVTSSETISRVAESLGYDISEFEESNEDIEDFLIQIDFDPEDEDGSGGTLH